MAFVTYKSGLPDPRHAGIPRARDGLRNEDARTRRRTVVDRCDILSSTISSAKPMCRSGRSMAPVASFARTPLRPATSRRNRTAELRVRAADALQLERRRDQPSPSRGNSRSGGRLLGWRDGDQSSTFRSCYDPGNDLPAHVWWAGRKGTILYVALNDPSLIAARVERAAAAFGLSPSQRRLTAFIVAGEPLTEAAKREGIRISTARTQLQRIFDKVGVRTQPALVRALLAVAGPSDASCPPPD